ncbi:uncharacterized protein LOC113130762 [Mastacembelus armatus]|uniref:uncharacterized protein LOC113130762 n=1 Tax=Mastacembelus armatus TaxID=205130 RepID=UPI000E4601BA|nr:uncharacterized protein LOC113130762 [Mastacembelus armatus]
MMKTLCVAVVVLSLISVCQPAPLTCEKLLKQVEKDPDLSGIWYLIALSSNICLAPALLNAFFSLSAEMDISAKGTPNIYDANFKVKMYGYCMSEPLPFLYKDRSLFDIDSNNAPTGNPDVLLQSGCPDCIILKAVDIINTLMVFSRRKTLTDAELKEFETQANCLGWSKPQVFSLDHDYENCKSLDNTTDADAERVAEMIYERLKTEYTVPLQCFYDYLHYPQTVFEWTQQMWNELW